MNALATTGGPAAAYIAAGRSSRSRRRGAVIGTLTIAVVTVFAVSLMLGDTFYPPADVARVIAGELVPGASFTIGELRLPRACAGVLAGFAFGAAGSTFQTMLRNPLAAPDIIGVTSGASAAAVFAIVVLAADDGAVSIFALGGALATAAAIYLLAYRGGFAGTRLILIGIGVAAMLDSVVTYLLSRAPAWDLQTATRWLTGSLNGASPPQILPLAVASLILLPVLFSQGRGLGLLRLGDDVARGLGVHTARTRVLSILSAVALLAFATAATGPIAFVAFMAGPTAARLVRTGSLALPAGLVGAVLVLIADLVGQFAFGTRYPVGVVTGVLGAPYLVYLLVRINRSGASL